MLVKDTFQLKKNVIYICGIFIEVHVFNDAQNISKIFRISSAAQYVFILPTIVRLWCSGYIGLRFEIFGTNWYKSSPTEKQKNGKFRHIGVQLAGLSKLVMSSKYEYEYVTSSKYDAHG